MQNLRLVIGTFNLKLEGWRSTIGSYLLLTAAKLKQFAKFAILVKAAKVALVGLAVVHALYAADYHDPASVKQAAEDIGSLIRVFVN